MKKEDIIEILIYCKRLLDDISFCYMVNGYIEMCKLWTYFFKLLAN